MNMLEEGIVILAEDVKCPHCVEKYNIGPVILNAENGRLLAMSRRDGLTICGNCAMAENLADIFNGLSDQVSRIYVEAVGLAYASAYREMGLFEPSPPALVASVFARIVTAGLAVRGELLPHGSLPDESDLIPPV